MAFTTDSLTTQLSAELNKARTVTGSNVDTLTAIVRESLVWLWNSTDWHFRLKTADLTTAASTATVDMASDFAELWHRWLRDEDNYLPLRFTEDVSVYQDQSNVFAADAEGTPRVAVTVRDTGVSTSFKWHFLITPIPDAVYVYPYWYVVLDPYTAGINASSLFADSSSPLWPSTFDKGWRLHAKFQAEQVYFPGDDRSEKTEKLFDKWFATQVAENDETMTHALEPIRDGYKDFVRTGRAAMARRGVW